MRLLIEVSPLSEEANDRGMYEYVCYLFGIVYDCAFK